jgi:hypothetical protein
MRRVNASIGTLKLQCSLRAFMDYHQVYECSKEFLRAIRLLHYLLNALSFGQILIWHSAFYA